MTGAGLALRSLAFVGAVALASPPAGAQPPPGFVMACAPCHGYDGIGHDPATPNLAGQKVIYLYNQMMAFRTGARKHPEMNFFAGQMTLDEMQAIAEYYSWLVPK